MSRPQQTSSPASLIAANGPLDAAPIAVEGRNCWRRTHAHRVRFIVDGEEYFSAVKAALVQAQHSVLILGWEMDSRVPLDRSQQPSQPNTIGELLDSLVRNTPGLHIRVLIWDSVFFYKFTREFLPTLKLGWLTHRRLRFRQDDSHPIGASHHQKIVVIDDRVAFVGGLDLAGRRWDSRAHAPDDPRRSEPAGTNYEPFHDLMMMVDGEAAAALGEIARQRWQAATGRLPRSTPPGTRDPWPTALKPHLTDTMVAIARTTPDWEGQPAVREIEQLFIDMIAAARHSIYIENQYFASRRIGRALAQRLSDPDCPEIIVVTSQPAIGFLERRAMGALRTHLCRVLTTQDAYGRLGLFAPMVGTHPLKVHAKLMIVDDRMVRIGSANFNNRSLGLDTECDAMVDAEGDIAKRRAIADFRNGMLAEHLGCTPEQVAATFRRTGSLIATIKALGTAERDLIPLDWTTDAALEPPHRTTSDILDPNFTVEAEIALVEDESPAAGRPYATRVGAVTLLLLALAVIANLWHWTELDAVTRLGQWIAWTAGLVADFRAPLTVLAAYLVAGLLNLPAFLLVVMTGALFGLWYGVAFSMLGLLGSASFLYTMGRLLGRDRVRTLAGRRVTQVSRAYVRYGFIAIALLRIVPVASFSATSLVVGAAAVGFRSYMLGTIAGIAPMVGMMSLFGARLGGMLSHPDAGAGAILMLLALMVAAIGYEIANRFARGARGRSSPGQD